MGGRRRREAIPAEALPRAFAARFAFALVFACASVSNAQEAGGWERLKTPGVHAIMRHALAPGTGDPEGFRLGDCATQRNLNESGRAQARAIGEAIRAAGVDVTRVLTSQWCRAAETARLLAVAPVAEEAALNSFFGDRSTEAGQTARLKALLAGAGADEKLVLVTHQVNMTALTGVVPASGEALLISVGQDGAVAVEARVATDAPR